MVDPTFDVLVVGGGAAGLSAALTLARARRRVLVIDAGEPRNAASDGLHGLISRDGILPHDLLAVGAAEVTGYGGTVVTGRATSARREERGGFTVATGAGERFGARRLLLATGLVDELPPVPGLAEHYGRDVMHCPYCRGWEVQDQPMGILSTGPYAVRQALLFRQWSGDVLFLNHTGPVLEPDQAERLAARDIPVVDGEVVGLEIVENRLRGIRLSNGRMVPRTILAVIPRLVARPDLVVDLGLVAEESLQLGTRIAAEPNGRTAVPGVFVAGNVADLQTSVVESAATGARVGAEINMDLVAEDTRLAVARRPRSLAATSAREPQ